MPLRCEWVGAQIKVTASLISGLALGLSFQSALAIDLKAVGLPSTYICENTDYDGASLPLPPKKKNQVIISTEEGPSETSVKKNLHKRQVSIDTSSSNEMTQNETAQTNASVLSKKTVDGGGTKTVLAPDRENRSEHRSKHDQGFFGTGPLDLTALNLTDEQKQKIGQMRIENGNKMRELMRKRRDLSLQMKDIMFGAETSEAQIRSKRDEVRQVQEKLEDLRLADFLSIRAILTSEQKQKLKDVRVANDYHRDLDSQIGQQSKRGELSEQKKLADSPAK